jgi:hypothetical protein
VNTIATSTTATLAKSGANSVVTSTRAPEVENTGTFSSANTIVTNTTPSIVQSTGTFSVFVDATVAQVKSATEMSIGKILNHQGVGSSVIEAAGYVTATVVSSRRLAYLKRRLAASQYSVAWNITTPSAEVLARVSTPFEKILARVSVTMETKAFASEMLIQFQAAGVTSATTVSVEDFSVGAQDVKTSSAPLRPSAEAVPSLACYPRRWPVLLFSLLLFRFSLMFFSPQL